MRRALSPALNPAGLMAAAGTVYAAVVMILNYVHHRGVIDPPVIVAALGAVAALLTRQVVTPVKDPRDGNGAPLVRPDPLLADETPPKPNFAPNQPTGTIPPDVPPRNAPPPSTGPVPPPVELPPAGTE